MTFKTLLTQSAKANATELANELTAPLKQAGASVRGGIVYCAVGTPIEPLQSALRQALGEIPFVGCTSCLGVGASGQLLGRSGPAAAALWLLGDEVRFGTALLAAPSEVGERAGTQLLRSALSAAGIGASAASFALFHSTPGGEEAMLRGVARELPAGVPVIGGTAADDDLSGEWALFTEKGAATKGGALAICHWPGRLATAYRGGYLPVGMKGKVTRAAGRVLQEIDGRPAAVVYNEWTHGAISAQIQDGGPILRESTLRPLGVPRGRLGSLDLHVLTHPERVAVPDRSLHLFAEVKEGEIVHLMGSSPTALVARGGQVVREALRRSTVSLGEIDAALMIYCAGCLLAIADKSEQMLATFSQATRRAPSLSAFTFGEAGCVVPDRIDHGNLMCCVLLLSSIPA